LQVTATFSSTLQNVIGHKNIKENPTKFHFNKINLQAKVKKNCMNTVNNNINISLNN